MFKFLTFPMFYLCSGCYRGRVNSARVSFDFIIFVNKISDNEISLTLVI